MKIKIDREVKIALLKSLKNDYLDTEDIPTINELLKKYEPARTLTPQEAKEYLQELEQNY